MALERRAVGRHIARLRARKRLTQPAAAERVGVALRTYQQWEGGVSLPYWRNLERLADVLDTTPEHILTGETAAPPAPPAPTYGDFDARLDRLEDKMDRLLRALEPKREKTT